MPGAVSDVLGRAVKLIEDCFAHCFPGGTEPGHVKGSGVQFLGGQGRETGDHRLAGVVKGLVHVGDEVIDGGNKAGYAQIFPDQFHPGRVIHGQLKQPFFGYFVFLHDPFQGRNAVLRRGDAHAQEMAQTVLPVELIGVRNEHAVPGQVFFSQRGQDTAQPHTSPNVQNAGNAGGIRPFVFPAGKLAVQDDGQELFIYPGGVPKQRLILFRKIGLLFPRQRFRRLPHVPAAVMGIPTPAHRAAHFARLCAEGQRSLGKRREGRLQSVLLEKSMEHGPFSHDAAIGCPQRVRRAGFDPAFYPSIAIRLYNGVIDHIIDAPRMIPRRPVLLLGAGKGQIIPFKPPHERRPHVKAAGPFRVRRVYEEEKEPAELLAVGDAPG